MIQATRAIILHPTQNAKLYTSVKESTVKPKLAESEYFAVRVDLWTSRATHPYFSCTVTCAAEVEMGLPVLTDALSGRKKFVIG